MEFQQFSSIDLPKLIMEKQPKLKNKILKILPKAAAAVSVTPFSPGRAEMKANRSRWFKHHGGKGFSGPMIPDEARTKPRDIHFQEPTSPKVSCMGQIKHNKRHIQKAKAKKSMSLPKHTSSTPREVNKHTSTFRKIFHGTKSDASAPDQHEKETLPVPVPVPHPAPPPLNQMKRFASGRDAFANFDWKAQENRDCSDEEEDIKIPFSAPILVGGNGLDVSLQPRKQINLWKRRTMEPPRSLQLNPLFGAD